MGCWDAAPPLHLGSDLHPECDVWQLVWSDSWLANMMQQLIHLKTSSLDTLEMDGCQLFLWGPITHEVWAGHDQVLVFPYFYNVTAAVMVQVVNIPVGLCLVAQFVIALFALHAILTWFNKPAALSGESVHLAGKQSANISSESSETSVLEEMCLSTKIKRCKNVRHKEQSIKISKLMLWTWMSLQKFDSCIEKYILLLELRLILR